MKNKTTKKRFVPSADKQYIKKFRIYPPFLYFMLDKWLKKMSSEGWHVVHCSLLFFWFEKGEPKNKEYFTYGLGSHEGEYSVSMRHPHLEKIYGVKKKKSQINSNESKTYNIVEIDTDRIDINNNVGYKELLNDRNRLYKKHFLRYAIALSVVTVILIFLSI